MKWVTLCGVALACATLSLASAKTKDAPSDRDALQGAWKLTGRVMRGEQALQRVRRQGPGRRQQRLQHRQAGTEAAGARRIRRPEIPGRRQQGEAA